MKLGFFVSGGDGRSIIFRTDDGVHFASVEPPASGTGGYNNGAELRVNGPGHGYSAECNGWGLLAELIPVLEDPGFQEAANYHDYNQPGPMVERLRQMGLVEYVADGGTIRRVAPKSDEEVREAALARLSDNERRVLGL